MIDTVMNIEMNIEEIVESVSKYLFTDKEADVFAVLDGASMPGLLDKLYGLSPIFCCLFRGEIEPDMAEVAPYLVQLEKDSEFTNWLIGQGWGNHYGTFAVADADFREMRRHFRSFLIVYDESGRPLRFRYYDPRVLRTYLPTCNAQESTTIFGPVSSYLLEDADPNTMLRFEITAGSVRKTTLPMNQA